MPYSLIGSMAAYGVDRATMEKIMELGGKASYNDYGNERFVKSKILQSPPFGDSGDKRRNAPG